MMKSKLFFLITLVLIMSLNAAPTRAANKSELPLELRKLLLKASYSQAVPQLKRLSSRGNAEAQFQLGMLFLNGNGVAQSTPKAMSQLNKSASANHARAAYNMGIIYMGKYGIKRNENLAAQFFSKASSLGHSMAEKKLAQIEGNAGGQSIASGSIESQLLHAAKKGDLPEIKRLLKSGASIQSLDDSGNNALILAVQFGQWRIADFLLSQKIKKNIKNSNGDTALHTAVNTGNSRSISILTKHRAAMEVQDKSGNSALMLATIKGDKPMIEQLLKAGAKPNTQNKFKQSPYHIAIAREDKAAQALLIKYGANTKVIANNEVKNQLNNFRQQLNTSSQMFSDWSDIMMAAWQGNRSVVRELLKSSPDLSIKDKNGNDALTLAIEKQHEQVALDLIDYMMTSTRYNAILSNAMAEAAETGNLVILKHLTRSGTRAPRNVSRSPMWLAVANGHRDMVRFLIQAKAPVNIRNTQGVTLLMLSAQKGHRAITSMLLKKGAKVNTHDKEGKTALWYAANHKQGRIAQRLLRSGANRGVQDKLGHFPLTRAIMSGYFPMVKLLTRRQDITGMVTKSGNTPLMVAIEFGNAKMVKYFLDLGSDIEYRNKLSYTPLMLAVKNKKSSVTRLLVSRGANPKRKSKEGKSAIDYAKGDKSLLRLL